MIGAIITYKNNGTHHPCGQTVGADGRGTWAIIFNAETIELAEKEAYQYIDKLKDYAEYLGHITEIHIITAEETFCGNGIQIIDVVTPIT